MIKIKQYISEQKYRYDGNTAKKYLGFIFTSYINSKYLDKTSIFQICIKPSAQTLRGSPLLYFNFK